MTSTNFRRASAWTVLAIALAQSPSLAAAQTATDIAQPAPEAATEQHEVVVTGSRIPRTDLTAASMVQDTFPGLGGMIILVREEDAESARNVITEGTSLPDDDTAEFQITEEPEQKP